MQVVLEGSLRYFPPAQILAFLGGHGHDGTLGVEAGGNTARIIFQKGKVVAAEATDAADSREAVLEIFAWPDGKFTFLDSASIPPKADKVSLEVEPLITEGLRRAAEGMLYADDDMLSVVDNLAAQEKITMSPDEFKLLFRIGAGKAFKELLGKGVKRRDMALKLQALEGAGLVTRVGDSGDRPAPRAEAPKAEPKRDAPKGEARPQPQKAEAKTVMEPRPAPKAASKPETPPPSVPEYEKTVIGELNVSPDAMQKTLVGVMTLEGGGPYPLVDEETTIGRDGSNGISIPDGSVSTKHARVLRNAGGFVLEDMQSRNGTFVNGEKITGQRPLADGDVVRLGKIILTFNLPKEALSGDATGNRTMFGPA